MNLSYDMKFTTAIVCLKCIVSEKYNILIALNIRLNSAKLICNLLNFRCINNWYEYLTTENEETIFNQYEFRITN